MMIAILFLSALIVLLGALLFKRNRELNRINNRYRDVIDVDAEVERKKVEIKAIEGQISDLRSEYSLKNEQLGQEYASKRGLYEKLLEELNVLEENLNDISFGLYKPN
jgi:chromosome segregation ATPase